MSAQVNTSVYRDLLPIALSAFGFLFLLLYMATVRAGDLPPYEMYWLSLLLTVSSIAFFAGGFSTNRSATFGLIFFSASVNLMYPLLTRSNVPYGTDSIYMYQLSSLILAQGSWGPGMGTGFAYGYSQYPLLPIFVSTFSLVTGIPLTFSTLWSLVPVRILVLPLLMIGFFRRYVTWEVCAIAAFIFLTGPLLLHTANETMGVVFVVALLYVVARERRPGSGFRILLPILIVALTLTHHFSSFFVLAWIITVLLAERLSPFTRKILHREVEGSGVGFRVALLAGLPILAWTAYVSYGVTGDWAAALYFSLVQLLFGFPALAVPAMQRFTPSELLIIYADMFLLALTTFLGLWVYVRRQRISVSILGGFLLAGLLTTLAIALRTTDVFTLFNRIFEFSYLGFVPLSALCILQRRFRRTAGPLVLIVLAIGGSLVVTFSPRMYYYSPLSTTYLGPVSAQEFTAGTWFCTRGGRSNLVYGDRRAFEIVGGFGRTSVDYWDAELIFVNASQYMAVQMLRTHDSHYIVMHRWMFLYPTLELDSPLDTREAQEFASMPGLARVYDDGSYWTYWA